MAINPCKRNCPEREMGCHGKCGRYRDFRQELDKENEQKRKVVEGYAYAHDIRERMARARRKQRANPYGGTNERK